MRRPGRGIDPHQYRPDGDAVGYAEQRLQLVRGIRSDLLNNYQGDSYQELYNSYTVLMNQLLVLAGCFSLCGRRSYQ